MGSPYLQLRFLFQQIRDVTAYWWDAFLTHICSLGIDTVMQVRLSVRSISCNAYVSVRSISCCMRFLLRQYFKHQTCHGQSLRHVFCSHTHAHTHLQPGYWDEGGTGAGHQCCRLQGAFNAAKPGKNGGRVGKPGIRSAPLQGYRQSNVEAALSAHPVWQSCHNFCSSMPLDNDANHKQTLTKPNHKQTTSRLWAHNCTEQCRCTLKCSCNATDKGDGVDILC
eukprot:1160450-Pelagomonas_calceolata.AAC.8